MAPRPYWKGYLKLSLVSCAVALYPAASKSERVAFHWLNRQTGNRLRQQMVDSESEEPVEREDRVRGFQLGKNDYLQLEESELDAVEIESSHTIEIERFTPLKEVDPIYLENSYYLVPNDRVAEEAFAVIREAMVAEGVAGIGRAVLSRRERLLLLDARGKGMLASTLHYNYEVRDEHAYFDEIPDIEVHDEMLELARHIIRTKKGHFDISQFGDRYENALIELVRAKQAGRPAELPKPSRPANVINLMDALRDSIAQEKQGEEEPGGAGERKSARKSATHGAPPRRKSEKERRPARSAAVSRTEPSRAERAGGGKPEQAKRARKPAARR